MRVLAIKVRQWLIRKLAGRMGVVLNASLGVEKDGQPYIAYASGYGGMCDLSGVKTRDLALFPNISRRNVGIPWGGRTIKTQ